MLLYLKLKLTVTRPCNAFLILNEQLKYKQKLSSSDVTDEIAIKMRKRPFSRSFLGSYRPQLDRSTRALEVVRGLGRDAHGEETWLPSGPRVVS